MNHQAPSEHLPGLNCGLCGEKTCEQFAHLIAENPADIEKCVHLSGKKTDGYRGPSPAGGAGSEWKDSLGRTYDFILDTFPNDPGPRETILPHNPARTRELDVQVGDILIGRPMGMSCGCPITHCGVVMQVDQVNGVIVWCVTGPLDPRTREHKDIGYYTAEAYEGIIKAAACEIKIGMRYWFLPHRCMLQWRHSGLVNFINKKSGAQQVRIEGLMIG